MKAIENYIKIIAKADPEYMRNIIKNVLLLYFLVPND